VHVDLHFFNYVESNNKETYSLKVSQKHVSEVLVLFPCVIKPAWCTIYPQFVSSINVYIFRAYLWHIITRYTVYIQQLVPAVFFSWMSVGRPAGHMPHPAASKWNPTELDTSWNFMRRNVWRFYAHFSDMKM